MAQVEVTRISAYGLLIDRGHLLLCRLSDGLPQAGMWTLPGGGLAFGEHPEAGMIREVEEETGLVVSSAGLAGIDSFRHDVPERSFHGVRIIYHANVIGGVLRNEQQGSTDMCQWQPLHALARLGIVDLVEVALPMVQRGA